MIQKINNGDPKEDIDKPQDINQSNGIKEQGNKNK